MLGTFFFLTVRWGAKSRHKGGLSVSTETAASSQQPAASSQMAVADPTTALFSAETGGVLVVNRRDIAEPLPVLMDRTWLCARALAADPLGRTAKEEVEAWSRHARTWAYWYRLGCEYDADTMVDVNMASRHAPLLILQKRSPPLPTLTTTPQHPQHPRHPHHPPQGGGRGRGGGGNSRLYRHHNKNVGRSRQQQQQQQQPLNGCV